MTNPPRQSLEHQCGQSQTRSAAPPPRSDWEQRSTSRDRRPCSPKPMLQRTEPSLLFSYVSKRLRLDLVLLQHQIFSPATLCCHQQRSIIRINYCSPIVAYHCRPCFCHCEQATQPPALPFSEAPSTGSLL
ncbi:hypothetical protein B296_00002117 [Ensete ventricosum]|uniref:Uncharacterized protein n=1 Tax=Ensete ventricosum TaxID=4639 RepID=A0A427ABK8_ENSVE|nr:hypothetical protein B296_00002117 [Ensete ventricosum]